MNVTRWLFIFNERQCTRSKNKQNEKLSHTRQCYSSSSDGVYRSSKWGRDRLSIAIVIVIARVLLFHFTNIKMFMFIHFKRYFLYWTLYSVLFSYRWWFVCSKCCWSRSRFKYLPCFYGSIEPCWRITWKHPIRTNHIEKNWKAITFLEYYNNNCNIWLLLLHFMEQMLSHRFRCLSNAEWEWKEHEAREK